MCYPWGVKQETSHVFSISPVFNLLLPPLNLTHERGTELVTDLGMQKATELASVVQTLTSNVIKRAKKSPS